MVLGLSVRQPWVELILRGQKTIEVRTWPTKHRGELWLHAGAKPEGEVLRRFGMGAGDVTLGALVGRCELVDCVAFTAETWERLRDWHLNEGPFREPLHGWFLREAVRARPTLMKGKLGFMRFERPEVV